MATTEAVYPGAVPGIHMPPSIRPKLPEPGKPGFVPSIELPTVEKLPKEAAGVEAAAEVIPGPPSTTELTRALKNNVDLIYEWVYSNVEYMPMWGLSCLSGVLHAK